MGSDPSSRILIPVMTCVRKDSQGCFNVIPATLVVESAPDQLGDKGAPSARAGPTIKLSHEIVIQFNV